MLASLPSAVTAAAGVVEFIVDFISLFLPQSFIIVATFRLLHHFEFSLSMDGLT